MSDFKQQYDNLVQLARGEDTTAGAVLQSAETQAKTAPDDQVNHPPHYTQGGVECIDAIAAAVTGLSGMEAVYTAQVIKYMWRWKHKNGVEDLLKAMWYLDRLIQLQP